MNHCSEMAGPTQLNLRLPIPGEDHCLTTRMFILTYPDQRGRLRYNTIAAHARLLIGIYSNSIHLRTPEPD